MIIITLVFSGLAAMTFYMHKNTFPLVDVAFGVGYLAYIYLANRICFNSNKLQLLQLKEPLDPMGRHSLGKGMFKKQPAFKSYMITFQLLTVLFPMVLLFAGPTILTAPIAPPLALLFAQCLGESTTGSFHDVLRILVPIGFNAYRLGPLLTWFRHSIDQYQSLPFGSSSNKDIIWITMNTLLATTNLALWSYNLFIFLLLRVLPVYFDRVDTPLVEMKYLLAPIPKTTSKDTKNILNLFFPDVLRFHALKNFVEKAQIKKTYLKNCID